MIQKLILLTTILLLGNNVNAGCLKSLDKDLKSTKIQLNKFSCQKKQPESKDFFCKKDAPDGWASYYSNKLKKIEIKVLKCIS